MNQPLLSSERRVVSEIIDDDQNIEEPSKLCFFRSLDDLLLRRYDALEIVGIVGLKEKGLFGVVLPQLAATHVDHWLPDSVH
jgi:hypothetical protein